VLWVGRKPPPALTLSPAHLTLFTTL